MRLSFAFALASCILHFSTPILPLFMSLLLKTVFKISGTSQTRSTPTLLLLAQPLCRSDPQVLTVIDQPTLDRKTPSTGPLSQGTNFQLMGTSANPREQSEELGDWLDAGSLD